jgi:hypothetical protein
MIIHPYDHPVHRYRLVKRAGRIPGLWVRALAIAVSLSVFSAIPASAAVQTLYAFDNWLSPGYVNGSFPVGTLLRDGSGALYGSTWFGGTYGNGVIFMLTPPPIGQDGWSLTVLHSFQGFVDGSIPNPVLALDSTGALYGTTQYGGSFWDEGVAFKLTPPAPGTTTWQYSVLHVFDFSSVFDSPDGAHPSGGLILGTDGALYGTTDLGGVTTDPSGIGFGTVFRLVPLNAERTNWRETVLYAFQSMLDGMNPLFALTQDAAGALYGTTLYGGDGPCLDVLSNPIGCGTVFQLSPPADGQTVWTKTTLHSFTGGTDGNMPEGRLILDPSGLLYGTTTQGGFGACQDGVGFLVGCGTVYQLAPTANGLWAKSIVHSFSGDDGSYPQGGVIMDGTGTLFGTASAGGANPYLSFGVVYRLSPPAPGSPVWTRTVLYNFDNTAGWLPVGELVSDSAGNLFGVANEGGPNGGGVVYEITP